MRKPWAGTGTGDTITNFNAAGDLIVLQGLGITNVTFLGASTVSFNSNVGDARFNDTIKVLEIDVDGSGTMTAADIKITLTGVSLADLAAGDFNWS